MKKTILTIATFLIAVAASAQTCYTVKSVENKTENPDLSSKKFTFGVKQITEELLSTKYNLCDSGSPVVVVITSIEAPSVIKLFIAESSFIRNQDMFYLRYKG